jgi:malonyl-CoA/methylmalonyl-CoA synthetase
MPAPALDMPALMLFTSGTTGRPKGVIHTHASLQNQVEVLREAWCWSPDDRLLHVLPLHHIHGLVNGMIGGLWAGASLRFLPRFVATDAWEALASGEISVFYAVPTIYHLLVEAWRAAPAETRERWSAGAHGLRLAVSGSAALQPALFEGWRAISGQSLLERYGMSETGMNLSNPYVGARRPGTVGQPLLTMDIRLVGEDGRDAEPGDPGEIWLRSPSLFREYWRRPDATAEAFEDGYFRTGDIAAVEDGYYRILGRATSDIIKSAGYKLSALEIEAVLSEHPAISEVAVVGVPSIEWGEVVTACVVSRQGQALDLATVRAFCGDRLSAYKHPRRLEIMADLPRNAMGKVLKAALIEKLSAPGE